MDKTMDKTSERLSLSERIARASAIRNQAATETRRMMVPITTAWVAI